MTQSRVLAIIWGVVSVLMGATAAWGTVLFVRAYTETHRPEYAMPGLDMAIGVIALVVGAIPAWISARLTRLFWTLRDSPTQQQQSGALRLRVWLVLVFAPVILLGVFALFGFDGRIGNQGLRAALLLIAALAVLTFIRLTRVARSAAAAD
jgi:hypothetical protein